MKRFIVRNTEEKERLVSLFVEGLVGCKINYGKPPKYFLYHPALMRVTEITAGSYNTSFAGAAEVAFDDFEREVRGVASADYRCAIAL